MPTKQEVVLEVGPPRIGRTMETLQTEMSDAVIRSGGKTLKIVVGQPLKPQFETTEGQAFRRVLPEAGYALTSVLEDAARVLFSKGYYPIYLDVFLAAYGSQENATSKGREGWELRELKVKYEKVKPEDAMDLLKSLDKTPEAPSGK